MNNNCRISVIMGVYNCSDTLEEALNSLFAQSYKNFKIIMCDDGSTDDTYEVALRASKGHNNVMLLRNESNMGLNFTLNRCLDEVDTEYVARMDGDDISLPTRFEKEIDYLDKHPEYDVISCPMIYFDENGDFRIGKAIEYPQKEDLIYGTPICHAPCMVRTAIMKKVGGYTVSKRLLRVEDYHLWMKIFCNGAKAYNLQEPLYKMRDDRNAIHRRDFQNRINESYVRYLCWKNFKLPLFYIIYCLRPIIVGLLPLRFYSYLHRK